MVAEPLLTVSKGLRLPSPVRLVSDVGDHATVCVSYDHGLPFAVAVKGLGEADLRPVPLLCLDADQRILETRLCESDRNLAMRLRGRGFGRTRRRRPLTKRAGATLVDDLRWALGLGMALDSEAWDALAKRGGCPPDERLLAWDAERIEGLEAWSWDAMGERMPELRAQMRKAVRTASECAVHVAPTVDGAIAQWREGTHDLGSDRSSQGFGALVLRRDGAALSVHMAADDFVSNRLLMDSLVAAMADEVYGAGSEFEWEFAGDEDSLPRRRRRPLRKR